MPVDLSGVNSIVQAFMAGRQISNERQSREDRLAKEAQDRKDKLAQEQLAQKNLETQIKEGTRRFDLGQKAADLANELAAEHQRIALQSGINESGITPPGYKLDNSQSVQTGEGTAGTSNDYSPEDIKSLLPKLTNVLDPETYARQQARIEEIRNQPKTDAAIRVKQAEDSIRYQEKHDTLEQQLLMHQDNNALALKIAEMSHASAADIQKMKDDSAKQIAELKDAFVKNKDLNLTPDEQDKYKMLDEVTNKARELQILLSGSGIKYYQGMGLSSLANEGLGRTAGYENVPIFDSKGQPIIYNGHPATYKDIRTLAGDLQSTLAQERFKSRFTSAEQQQLNTYVPTPNRTEAPDSVGSKLPNLIKSLDQQKRDLKSPKIQRDPNSKPSLDSIFGGG